MNKNSFWKWLLLVNLATSFYCVGAVWLAQLDWMLWQYVGQADFILYHNAWWHGIWWSIFPLAGLSFLGICFQLKWRPPYVRVWVLWLALLLQVIVYAGTVFWWGQGQSKLNIIHLADGALNPLYVQLISTNWLRVALLTLSGLLEGWIGIKCFVKKDT